MKKFKTILAMLWLSVLMAGGQAYQDKTPFFVDLTWDRYPGSPATATFAVLASRTPISDTNPRGVYGTVRPIWLNVGYATTARIYLPSEGWWYFRVISVYNASMSPPSNELHLYIKASNPTATPAPQPAKE